ncbi:MAG TPA: hypothetical protein VMS88_06870 [Terriglobales bacterium]|nr:hypothetical protein [Terriglobales bacterium]
MMAALPASAARKRPLPFASLFVSVLFCVLPCAAFTVSVARAADAPPGGKLELGFEERVRSENWDNIVDFNAGLDDARHQWRYRTRLWAKYDRGSRLELNVGLNNESRRITHPVTDFYPDETIFETLYLDYRFADGVTARIGRQNITRGDGLLLFDATPLDGSRTQYFNAATLGYAAEKSRLDLYVISDPVHDEYLPRFDNKNKPLQESNERAFVAYGTDTKCRNTTLEAYYVFKTEAGDIRPTVRDRAIHTLGARAVLQPRAGWEAKAELAGQLGSQQPATDVRGGGGTASLKHTWAKWKASPALLLGWTGLSGDDPATPAYEGWDPLFSRWPKWSEMMVYTLAGERSAAYWTDLAMWQAEVTAAPWKPVGLRATYYRLDAFHPSPGKASVFAAGTHRGDLFEARADVKANDLWRGHLLIEYLKPGDYYAGSDAGWFFRGEVTYSFKRMFPL